MSDNCAEVAIELSEKIRAFAIELIKDKRAARIKFSTRVKELDAQMTDDIKDDPRLQKCSRELKYGVADLFTIFENQLDDVLELVNEVNDLIKRDVSQEEQYKHLIDLDLLVRELNE